MARLASARRDRRIKEGWGRSIVQRGPMQETAPPLTHILNPVLTLMLNRPAAGTVYALVYAR